MNLLTTSFSFQKPSTTSFLLKLSKNLHNNLKIWLLLIILIIMTGQFLMSRTIKLHFTHQEAYLMRFQWLDSVNQYLKTGKILMHGELRLEDVALGEDQGYPFILSMLGRISNLQSMNFGHFVRFNYVLFVIMGMSTSLLLYFSFNSFVLAFVFYFFYLRTDIYNGGIDHHWMLGIFVPFYISLLILVVFRRPHLNIWWLTIYFFTAGIANIVREGNGVVAILLFGVLLTYIALREGILVHLKLIPKKIFLMILFIIIYFLPLLVLSSVRFLRNQNYFNGLTSDKITHHGIWHNAFMGYSFIVNPYGIVWDDGNNLPFVQKISPKATYMSNEYFTILRHLYFKVMLESPLFWIKNLLAKLTAIHVYLNSLFPRNFPIYLPMIIRQYSFYILVGILYQFTRKSRKFQMIFFINLVMIAISTIPGMVAIPISAYLIGLQASYLMLWIYLFGILYTRLFKWIKNSYV